jgi:hypothetical protein
MKIFNIDNVTLGNSETLDISKSGDGNAVLLAISAILQSDRTEAQLTELLSNINTDIRTDGTLDSTTTKATLLSAMEYLKSRRSTIRSNIESRYSNLGISATIPAFESYAFKLDTTAPTVSSTSPADSDTTVSISSSISVTFSEIMDNTSVTTNTSDTSCTGTFQVSSDNFSTCVQMSASPSLSVSNSYDNTSNTSTTIETFEITPASNLTGLTTYKLKVTSNIKDVSGNQLNSTYVSETGFTTWSTNSTFTVNVQVSGTTPGGHTLEIFQITESNNSQTQDIASTGNHTITISAGRRFGFSVEANPSKVSDFGYTIDDNDRITLTSNDFVGTSRNISTNPRKDYTLLFEWL